MSRYFFYVLATVITYSSFSQTVNNRIYSDPIVYNTYLDSVDGISFDYPKSWDTTKIGVQYLFTATEQLTSANDKFKENLLFGKVEISADLNFLLQSAAQSLQKDNKEIVITEQQIKTNINGVRYAILKYTSSINNIECSTINVYLKNGKYGYYLVIGNDIGEEKKYSEIYNKMVESIKVRN